MRSLLATRSCNTAAVMRRPGDDFLDSHPGFALTLLIVLTLLMVFALAMTVRWHRDREAYLKQAHRLAAARPDFSLAYAQGFLALGWLTYVGFLLLFSFGVWVRLFHGSYEGKIWLVWTSTACWFIGMVLPYFYWPRWMMPRHARSDVSPFQQRRQPRHPGTD